jgi:predicted MPP superfamily phosphohydrolase
MLRVLFFVLLTFALLGDARMFLFLLNRFVFGDHKEERNPYNFLIYVLPPIFLGLTLLFWPLHQVIDRVATLSLVRRVTPDAIEYRITTGAWPAVAAHVGAAWLLFAAAVGLYWIVDRIRLNYFVHDRVKGIRSLPSELVPLRKAHIPIPALRRLGAHNDLYDIEVTRYELFIDDLPPAFDGYRVAFLTDTHVASFVRRAFYREILARVRAFDPDLVLLGGDFVSWQRHIALAAEVLLNGLAARDGLYAVLGNHDYWAGAAEVVERFTAKGVTFLTNRSVELQRGGQVLHLAGIDEVYRGKPDVAAAFAEVPAGAPCLGVSHHPDIIDSLEGRRLDLLVCGHTHGGQIRFPFFGAVVVPSKHEGRYAAGFKRQGGVLMYVSRGIGAIPPIRILCRPEVATFVLKKGNR